MALAKLEYLNRNVHLLYVTVVLEPKNKILNGHTIQNTLHASGGEEAKK